MIATIRRGLQRWRGTGEHTITLPPMDGALRANQALEDAALVLAMPQPDNLVRAGLRHYASQGRRLVAVDLDAAAPRATVVAEFDAAVSALAGDARGNLVAGFDDGTLRFVAGPWAGAVLAQPGVVAPCPTALLIDGDALYVCHGSQRHPPSAWKRDLMQREASGSVWRMTLDGTSAQCLARDLAYPYGLARAADGRIVVTESWRHRLLALNADGSPPQVLLDDLPGYPARLAPAADGGHWLCVFAPRSRLVELVLGERDFCDDMLAQLAPEHWIAPDLHSGRSFLEPLQGGGVKQMGILKPWAPSRSYGMLVKLDAAFQPRASFHSRADGARHGVTSCIEAGERVFVASQGGDAIVALAAPGAGAAA